MRVLGFTLDKLGDLMDSMAAVWREQRSRFHSVTVEPLFKTLLLFLLKLYHRELKHTLTYRVVMSVNLRTVNIDFAKQTLICHEFITNFSSHSVYTFFIVFRPYTHEQ